jgi:hypothetical protein
MRPRRLQSATIFSMVTGPATAEQAIGRRASWKTPVFPHLHVNSM